MSRQGVPRGGFFEAPGWPGVKLWKNAFGKVFTAADYVPVLQGWKDGSPIDVSGLVSAKPVADIRSGGRSCARIR